jgi:hypothetical protein
LDQIHSGRQYSQPRIVSLCLSRLCQQLEQVDQQSRPFFATEHEHSTTYYNLICGTSLHMSDETETR